MAIERIRMAPETWQNYTVPELVEAPMFDRGYTGHEHITTFGEKVITPMKEEGLNAGLMIYQPFK